MRELIEAARQVRERAYTPYSNFKVGAALLSDRGVFVGCNVENASYPQGTCAEAGAIAAMIAGGGRRIEAVAVYAEGPLPIAPCGGCRQKLAEFAAPDVPVTLAGPEQEIETTVGALLPGAFGMEHLE